MHIAILSINHKLAGVEVREKIAFNNEEIHLATTKLNAMKDINGSLILSTCNRLEIYISSKNNNELKDILYKFLISFHNIKDDIYNYLDYFTTITAIKHICKVASGLDSLVLGEPQILGQLKDAYAVAKQNKSLDKVLEKLFQYAFASAKDIRTTTDIGKNPVSIAYCGIKLSEKIFTDISKQNALLIGSGEMIKLSAQYLRQKNINNIVVANRTKENAEKITNKYGGTAVSLKQLPYHLANADIVISSTAASVAIIGKGMIETAIKKRKHKPIFILDIAVPRDVETEVVQLDDVFLYTVDDLKQVINNNTSSRKQAAKIALEIINKKAIDFMNYLNTIPKENLIKKYQQNAEKIKNDAVLNAIKAIKSNKNTKEVIQKLADQLTNKLLHQNLINIKKQEEINKCFSCIPVIKK